MAEREELLEAVRTRLRRVEETDYGPLLEPAAVVEAERLEQLLDDRDLEGRYLLGWLRWCRYCVLPEEEDQDDLDAALAVFSSCFLHDPQLEGFPEPPLPDLCDVVGVAAAMLEEADGSPAPGFGLIAATLQLWPHILAHVPADHPERSLCEACLTRVANKRQEMMVNSDEFIPFGRRFLDTSAPDLPNRHEWLIRLMFSLMVRFDGSGARTDLDEAVELARQAVETLPAGRPDRPLYWSRLGSLLQKRFESFGDPADLDEAVEYTRQAVEVLPADHPGRGDFLNSLGAVLSIRFERSGRSVDLDEAIAAGRQAVGSDLPDTPRRAMWMRNLTGILVVRFERAGAVDDLEEAIALGRRAVASTPADDPDFAGCLETLGGSLLRRFERAGAVADLDEAIAIERQAVASTPADDPNRIDVVGKLGNALSVRFERYGRAADLDEAIAIERQAVASTPDNHPHRAAWCSNLGSSLRRRFHAYGGVADLDEAIGFGRQAVALVPDHDLRRATYLNNLVALLGDRFGRFGSEADLDEAISAGRRAVEATADDHFELSAHLHTLSVVLRRRFAKSGAAVDLQESAAFSRQAVALTPDDHSRRATFLNHLGTVLLTRFERFGREADLDEAVEVGRQAVDAASGDDPGRAQSLSNLGAMLRTCFAHRGDAGDLDEAVEVGLRAVDSVPHDHPRRAEYLNNLANSLRTRGDAGDLDEAVEINRAAVESTPDDHLGCALYLHSLGCALEVRLETSGAAADLDEAVWAHATVAGMTIAAPAMRVDAARTAGVLLAGSDPQRAAGLLADAVELLPQVAPRGLERSDQRDQLGTMAGLAGDAAASALSDPSVPVDERAGRALGLLESGRALLLAQVMETRSDLTDLRAEYPDLARRFTELRALIDQPASAAADFETDVEPETVMTRARRARDRQQAAAELAALLGDIRALDEFASFGLPPAPEVLRDQARQGPVVSFNVNRRRSDALILTEQGVTVLPLPHLTPEEATARAAAFEQARKADDQRAGQEQLREILAWLWDKAVGPVLDALGFDGLHVDGQPWPRVWWIAGGALNRLPLHAAGHHTKPKDPGFRARTALDRVVSSYTPTIRALDYARRHTAMAPAPDRTLLVAMPSTPGLAGQGVLQNVAGEIAGLLTRLPQPVLLASPGLDDGMHPIPTREAVFDHLARATVAHFACHGFSDPIDPSRSRLFLSDWEQDPLTVDSLTPVNLDHARLAYLSACSTSESRNLRLLDESIHLASAFQLAGFPHVVGTLWEVNDTHAARITRDFYDHLLDGGKVDTDHAAHALHHAVRLRRDNRPLQLSLWAAHLHAGA